MTYGRELEVKIGIGSCYYWSSDPKLAKQSDRGKGVNYGNSGLMYICTVVSSTSKLDEEKYIHNSSILGWNGMKLWE